MMAFSGACRMPDYGASSTYESIAWSFPPVNTGYGDAYDADTPQYLSQFGQEDSDARFHDAAD